MELTSFPTTRYQGSKRKMLPWIYSILKDIEFETVLDGFGGTGSVSYLFKSMGKRVTYNDVLRFNHYIGKAIIENSTVRLQSEDLQRMIGILEGTANSIFIQENFTDCYYRDNENQWIDRVSTNLAAFNASSEQSTLYKASLGFYALFQACMVKRPFNLFHRKNLKIRTRKVKRSFHNSRAWETPFEQHFLRFAEEANKSVFDSGKRCRSINESILEIGETEFDLVYLDPPYFRKEGSNETSNYLNCYHFLEGLANYEKWPVLIDRQTRNLRFKADYIRGVPTKGNIGEMFEQMFLKFKHGKIVVSYKYGGIPSVESITRLLKKFKRTVTTRSKHYHYALNHQNGDAVRNREFLIIGL